VVLNVGHGGCVVAESLRTEPDEVGLVQADRRGPVQPLATNDYSAPTANELVIPVYLDTNVLLDLLATVEDGFSLVERVTSGQSVKHP